MKVDSNFGFAVKLLDASRVGFFGNAEEMFKDMFERPEELKKDCDVLAVVFCIVYKISITGANMYDMITRYDSSSEDFASICKVIDDTLDFFVRNMEVA